MVHPDYIIGVVLLLVIFALLPIRIRYEREEIEAERKAEKPQPKMSDQKFAELVTLLAQHEELHEAGHPHDHLPYQITKVILPMENDHQKWN